MPSAPYTGFFLGKSVVCLVQYPPEMQTYSIFMDQVKFPFWSFSFTLLERHLCHLFCYQVSCFCTCLHYVQYSPRSQGTENLVSQFHGYVRRKLLRILLAFVFYLMGKIKNQNFDNSPFFPNNYFKLKFIASNNISTGSKLF